MLPTAEGVVCLGYGATPRVAWVFRPGSPVPEPTLLPASTWRVALFQNRLLGITAGNTLLLLDRDGQHRVQLTLTQQAGPSVDALLAGGRLVVLSNRPSTTVSVYALP